MHSDATDSADRTGDVSHCVFISNRQDIRRLSFVIHVQRSKWIRQGNMDEKCVVFMSSLEKKLSLSL